MEKVWLGFWRDEEAPSPKTQEYVGVQVQLAGVAWAVKETVRGAAPEAGDAEALHVRVQAGVAVTVPDLEQLFPPTVIVMVQVYVPAVS